MGRVLFREAVTELGQATDVDYLDTFEKLEIIILDHRPTTLGEITEMLDVIIPDVEAGGRSDGRDVAALRNIRSYLGTYAA